jgi:hypothetical protein
VAPFYCTPSAGVVQPDSGPRVRGHEVWPTVGRSLTRSFATAGGAMSNRSHGQERARR